MIASCHLPFRDRGAPLRFFFGGAPLAISRDRFISYCKLMFRGFDTGDVLELALLKNASGAADDMEPFAR
jgi:hypothetical protein